VKPALNIVFLACLPALDNESLAKVGEGILKTFRMEIESSESVF
jgi:hypothetical protein